MLKTKIKKDQIGEADEEGFVEITIEDGYSKEEYSTMETKLNQTLTNEREETAKKGRELAPLKQTLQKHGIDPEKLDEALAGIGELKVLAENTSKDAKELADKLVAERVAVVDKDYKEKLEKETTRANEAEARISGYETTIHAFENGERAVKELKDAGVSEQFIPLFKDEILRDFTYSKEIDALVDKDSNKLDKRIASMKEQYPAAFAPPDSTPMSLNGNKGGQGDVFWANKADNAKLTPAEYTIKESEAVRKAGGVKKAQELADPYGCTVGVQPKQEPAAA